MNDFDLSDIERICCNCKFEGQDYSCLSKEREFDIINNCKKESSEYCAYFKYQDWMLKKFKKNKEE